jgi:branched-chain amino acid transport system ATP-binding protein
VTALLDVDHVSRFFGGVAAVDDVSMVVNRGETVGLVGSNGAGKTTLFRLIAGELSIDSGQIRFEGVRLSARADARSRQGIGRTFQLVELFGGLSVLDHLLVSLQAHEGRQGPMRDLFRGSDTTADELQRCMDVLDLCGLESVAEVPATTLPLGQRRAVEMARALVSRPKLLLADEPSSGLASDEATAIIDVIKRVRQETGLAIVLVDHDLETVEAVAERVVAMDAGRIIAEGSFHEVTSDPAVITSWLGRPV